jgi:DNA-binding transcriptional regulator YiaG
MSIKNLSVSQMAGVFREALGLTQQQFAKRIGASRETIARWEIGLTRPKGLYLQALEKVRAKAKKKM